MKRSKRAIIIAKNVLDNVAGNHMLDPGDKVLVAVSGGPDSVCLLDILDFHKKKLGIELFVANIDHGIRGQDSEKDSVFVKKLSAGKGLVCAFRRISIRNMEKGKSSVEEIARNERYQFLLDSAKLLGCNVIATGHTIDDQAETVLMRVINGTTLKGISGISPVRYWEGVKIIRPLLKTCKTEIMEYLTTSGMKYRIDKTNFNKKYLRNDIRLGLMPQLKKYNPRIKRALSNLADNIREDSDLIEETKNAMGVSFEKESGNRYSIDIKNFKKFSRPLQKYLFKRVFEQTGGVTKKLSYTHWLMFERFLRSSTTGKIIELPGKIRVKRGRGKVVFSKT